MNKKFSELESAGVLTGGELLAISQKDTNNSLQSKAVNINALKSFIGPGFTETRIYTSGFDTSQNFAGGSYWKAGILLDNASGVSPVNVSLSKVPCDADGNPLMYTLNAYLDGEGMERAVAVLLTVFGEINQFRDIETDEFTKEYAPTFSLTYWR